MTLNIEESALAILFYRDTMLLRTDHFWGHKRKQEKASILSFSKYFLLILNLESIRYLPIILKLT